MHVTTTPTYRAALPRVWTLPSFHTGEGRRLGRRPHQTLRESEGVLRGTALRAVELVPGAAELKALLLAKGRALVRSRREPPAHLYTKLLPRVARPPNATRTRCARPRRRESRHRYRGQQPTEQGGTHPLQCRAPRDLLLGQLFRQIVEIFTCHNCRFLLSIGRLLQISLGTRLSTFRPKRSVECPFAGAGRSCGALS